MERTRTSARTLLLGTAVSISLGMIALPLSFDAKTLTIIPKSAEARNGNGGDHGGSHGGGHGGGNGGGNGGANAAASGGDVTAEAGERGQPPETAGARGMEASNNPNAGPGNNSAENASDMARAHADENSAVSLAATSASTEAGATSEESLSEETTTEETTTEETTTEETTTEETTGEETTGEQTTGEESAGGGMLSDEMS